MSSMGSIVIRLLKVVALLGVLLLALGVGAIWYLGAWPALFPSSDHDTVPPALPAELGAPAVLVFSKTNGYRHVEGIAGGTRALQTIARARGWTVFATENGAVFNPRDLERFDAVVFLNASGDILDNTQEAAFEQWLRGGGGWLGIHSAGDSSHDGWQWYMDELIGAEFTAHIMGPQFQRATVVVEDTPPGGGGGLAAIWDARGGVVFLGQSPRSRGFTILAVVDEESYNPVQNLFGFETDLRMGDHPVVWSRCVGEGRGVYATMGHKAEAFDNPEFRRIIGNALSWVMGESAGGCEGPAALLRAHLRELLREPGVQAGEFRASCRGKFSALADVQHFSIGRDDHNGRDAIGDRLAKLCGECHVFVPVADIDVCHHKVVSHGIAQGGLPHFFIQAAAVLAPLGTKHQQHQLVCCRGLHRGLLVSPCRVGSRIVAVVPRRPRAGLRG